MPFVHADQGNSISPFQAIVVHHYAQNAVKENEKADEKVAVDNKAFIAKQDPSIPIVQHDVAEEINEEATNKNYKGPDVVLDVGNAVVVNHVDEGN